MRQKEYMKALPLLLLFTAFVVSSYGQKVEYAVQLNSGLTSFRGASASKSTTMSSYTTDRSFSYTHSPYGNRFALSYGASVQLQRVTIRNALLGIQLAAETLRTRIDIDGVSIASAPHDSFFNYQVATGKTILINNNLNLQPYLGFRKKAGAFDLDFTFGTDVAYHLKRKEKGKATATDGSEHSTDTDKSVSDLNLDVRPRVGLTAYHNLLGVSASYALGLINYLSGYDGGSPEAFTRVVRIGVLYRL
jgi:hypothetical protein